MGISEKCMCLKSFNKPEMGSMSNSQKIQQQQGKEKVPAAMVPPDDNNIMDSSSSGNSKGYRKKIKKKCNRVFKAVLSTKKQSTKQEEDKLKSSISALDDALRPLNRLGGGGGGKNRPGAAVDTESPSVSSRYSLLSSSSTLPGTSTSSFSSGQPSLSTSNCSSIANSRSGSERKQYNNTCNVVDSKSQQQPLIKNDISSSSSPSAAKRSCKNHAIYFVLVCLVGVIFGGKALAIFCTSSCLFLVPCCLGRYALHREQMMLTQGGSMRQCSKSFKEK